MTEIKRANRHLTKKEQREVLKELQAIAQKYGASLSNIWGVIDRAVKCNTINNFRIPEEKKLKHTFPEEMTNYVLSIPDLCSYRICDVRDMVLEKFPNSDIEPQKIYWACNYLINRTYYIEKSKMWHKNNKEASLENAKRQQKRKRAIRKELKEKDDA